MVNRQFLGNYQDEIGKLRHVAGSEYLIVVYSESRSAGTDAGGTLRWSGY